MRILLIEDGRKLDSALRSALNHAGYVVDWVRRGDDALMFASDGGHDVALLGLSELDGIDLLKRESDVQLVTAAKHAVRPRAGRVERDVEQCRAR